MPPPVQQSQIDSVAPFLEAVGVPSSLTQAFWAAIEAAGLTVVDQAAGVPVQSLTNTPGERVLVEGMPRTFLCGVQVGQRGWLTWVEVYGEGGSTVVHGPVFAEGAGQLITRAPRTGVLTVGTSDVGGTDTVG